MGKLNQWSQERSWSATLSELNDQWVYLSPTEVLGRWIRLETLPHRKLRVSLLTDRTTESVEFSQSSSFKRAPSSSGKAGAPSCGETKTKITRKIRAAGGFEDSDLIKTVGAQKSGLIYVWSPHMPLSVEGFTAAQAAAQAAKVAFVPLLDAEADQEFALKTAREQKFPESALRRQESMELHFRGMAAHFPSAVAFTDGKIQGAVIAGLESKEGYQQMVSGGAQ
jgi:hypothetical protein